VYITRERLLSGGPNDEQRVY